MHGVCVKGFRWLVMCIVLSLQRFKPRL